MPDQPVPDQLAQPLAAFLATGVDADQAIASKKTATDSRAAAQTAEADADHKQQTAIAARETARKALTDAVNAYAQSPAQ